MRIVCIDDDPHLRMLIAAALAGDGDLEARLYASGAEALAACADDPPDLVLTDIMMPGMDGHEVLRRMRADPRTAHLPVVFMTGKAGETHADEYKREGAVGVIAKPFDLLALPALLRGVLGAVSG